MALDTYDNLVKQIITYSHRNDVDELIPDFIQLAENEAYSNDVQPLKVRSMEFVAVASVDTKFLATPDRFEYARSLRLKLADGSSGTVRFQDPDSLDRCGGTGIPLYFSVIGNQIEFNITPDQAYDVEMQYFAKPEPLTDDNQTNTVLTNHPGVYLFGALSQLFAWAADDENRLKYENKFIRAIKGANKADKKGRFGPAPVITYKGSTP